MKGYDGLSRWDLFERFDRPALRPLPAERFVYTEWRQARVNIDYHVDVAHCYSVPYALIHQRLDIRLSATIVEVFQRGTRVWVHRRSAQVGGYTTVAEIAGGHDAEGADGGQRADLRAAQRHVAIPCPDALAFTTPRQLEVAREDIAGIERQAFARIGQPATAALAQLATAVARVISPTRDRSP